MKASNPVLVEVIRGGAVESEHRGRATVVSSTGETLWSIGDTEALTYPRSAIKAFQALPMVAAGAADRFGLGNAELALCCGSHNGEPEHIQVANGFLARLNLQESAFECGRHWPMGQDATIDLAWHRQQPDARHNNCSGKHLGMLALAQHQGWELTGYVLPEHPVQQAVKECIEQCCDTTLEGVPAAPDGCSVPTWAMPLHRLALGFARFADPAQLPEVYRRAATRLYQAVVEHPRLVAGSGRYCSEVMAALAPTAFLKVGAEGVYVGSIPELKLGIALKMDSGSSLAAEVAMSAILGRLGLPVPPAWQCIALRNRNDWLTGQVRPAAAAFSALELTH